MNLLEFLVLLTMVSCLGPLIRFKGHGLFYFFFILAISDPTHIFIRRTLIHNNEYTFIHYMIISALLVLSLPDLKLKYKIAILISAIIFLIIEPSDFRTVIGVALFQLYLILYFSNTIINDIFYKSELKYYLLILVFYHATLLVTKYIYYTDLSLHIKLYNYRLALNILSLSLIAILGPEKGTAIKSKLLEKLKARKKVIIYNYNDEEARIEIKQLRKYGLTEREIEILKLISRGYTSKEIAEQLYLSKKTIDYYRSNIRAKLNLSKKSEIVQFLKEKNLFFENQESYQTKPQNSLHSI